MAKTIQGHRQHGYPRLDARLGVVRGIASSQRIAFVGALIASRAIPATKFDTSQQVVEAVASSPALDSLLERS